MNTHSNIHRLIKEELSKPEIISLINAKLENNLSSRDFEKKVKEITSNVVSELFKILWQQKSFWENRLKN